MTTEDFNRCVREGEHIPTQRHPRADCLAEPGVRVTVTDTEGLLLDTVTVSRAEFYSAQRNPIAAQALLSGLQIGVPS